MAKGTIRIKREDLIAKLKAARAENAKKRQEDEKKALAEQIESAKAQIANLQKFLKNPKVDRYYSMCKDNDNQYESVLKMLELCVDDVVEYSMRSNDWYHISSLL